MAEAIAFDVAAHILIKLGDAVFREICLVYGVDDDLKKLEETLVTVNAILLDVDRRKEESHLMKEWIKKLNDVVYDADDMLDAFNTKNLQQHQLSIIRRAKMQVNELFSSSNKLAFRHKMGREMKKIRERLDEIDKTMSKYKFIVTERVIDQPRVGGGSYRDTPSYVAESYVIGRKKEKDEIIDMLKLSSNEEKVSIVSIVGIGGLGKTTLAQSVYCDKRVDEHFQFKIWVCVSEDFEKKSLVRRILKSITKNEVGDLEMEQLQSKLRENIDGKKYLLILDDIWNEDHEKWIDVKPFLDGGAPGSKILVTTRSTRVTSAMDVEKPYILEGLTEEHSWALFEKFAFRGQKEVHAYMESVGKEIIKRCKGVPLAIRSLGSVMQSKTKEREWLAIRNSDIWPSLENNNSILAILKLSYDHLPIHLRQCFVYCSIFPKDHKFEKGLLVQLWMAQGYIQCSGESQNLEDIGDQYFEDLISRSFFQDVEVTSDDAVRCKMHDLIHDLAIRVGGPRYCSIAENSSVNVFERVNHVSFGLLENVPTQLIQAKGLRTYFSTEKFHRLSSLEQARPNKLLLSKIRRLRALDLRKCGIEKLSKLVGKMQHLRFLDLSMNEKMEVLPNSITNLVNLQMLNLSSCKGLKELPEDISKLISLRHLIIDECDIITRMPRGLGKLTSLRTLSKFVVGDDKRSAKLEELKGLNNLRGDLCIVNLEKVKNSGSESKEANLMGKQYLKSLTLNWSIRGFEKELVAKEDAEILLEGLQPHPNLKELEIYGYCGVRLPSWIQHLTALEDLYINNCKELDLTDDGMNWQGLGSLCNIRIWSTYNFDKVDAEILLEGPQLTVNGYCGVRFPSWIMGICISLPNIVAISFSRCPNIRHLPPFHQLPCLKTLFLGYLPEVEYDDESSSSSFSPSFPCLTHLDISDCPKLTSMPGPPLLETLRLERVSQKLLFQLLTTTIRTTIAATIPSSSPLSRLTSLSIEEMEDSESLPFFPEGVPQNLTSLKNLTIGACPRLLHLAVSGEIQHLTALEDLYINECKELDLTRDGMNWQGLRSLRKITFNKIPKLVSLPEGIQHITTLKSLSIWGCPRLLHLAVSGEIQHLTALEDLYIINCKELDLTDDGMNWQGLRSLRTIVFRNIPKLVSLPEGLQHITTLKIVYIRNCPGLVDLPEWTSNIPYLFNSRW